MDKETEIVRADSARGLIAWTENGLETHRLPENGTAEQPVGSDADQIVCVAGDAGVSTAGANGIAITGNGGTAIVEKYGIAIMDHAVFDEQTAQWVGAAVGGAGCVSIALGGGTAMTGDSGIAFAREDGEAQVSGAGVAIAYQDTNPAIVSATSGVIIIGYPNPDPHPTDTTPGRLFTVGIVGQDDIKPGQRYTLDTSYKFLEVH